jgi:chitodextrinase
VITWTTDEPADSQVFYRRSGDTTYQQTAVDSALVTAHSVPLSGLEPETTYEYHVRSADSAGNAAVSSPDQTFTTPVSPYFYLTFEAESGVMTNPIRETSGSGAFAGAWIDTPGGRQDGTANNPTGTADFDVYIPRTGTWYLWLRMYAPDPQSGSWFESVDGAARQPISTSEQGVWNWVAGRFYFLDEGLHDVELGGHETGARADRVLLSDDPDFVPTAQPGADVSAPQAVTLFTATPMIESNDLSWDNPSDTDYAKTIIRYRTDGQYPLNPADGYPVVEKQAAPGSTDTHTHDGLSSGTVYYYSAFAVDADGNVADPAQTEAQPLQLQPPAPPGNLRLTSADPSPGKRDGSGSGEWSPAIQWLAERRSRTLVRRFASTPVADV